MNILILKVSAIGDVIHTLPAVFYLKKCYPNAKVSWVVQKKAADLLVNQPFLDKVFVLPDKFLHPKNWAASLKIIKELRKTKWDAILDFQSIDKTSIIISFLKGKKFGFASRIARSKFSTWLTQFHVDIEFKNIIQKNLGLACYAAQELGDTKTNTSARGACPPKLSLSEGWKPVEPYERSKTQNLCSTQCPTIGELKKDFSFNFNQAGKNTVNDWLKTKQIERFILLCPNTTWETKHWPNELWIEFIKLTSQEKLQYKMLLVGQQFGKAANKLAQLCQEKNLPVFIVPAWNLNTTAYLISKTDLLIAPDTGLLHLADFLNTTTIGIFDPTSKELQGPFLKDINIENAIQTGNILQPGFQVTNNMNQSNFQKSTPYQANMCKLQPSMLLDKVLHILKNKN